MTPQAFNDFLDVRLAQLRAVMDAKSTHYARAGDKLHNFKAAAAAMGCTPERALIGMWMKHVVSILDLVADLERDVHHGRDVWEEKTGDAVNYLLLLEALRHERG